MRNLYAFFFISICLLLLLPATLLGQCSTRPAGADRYSAIEAGLLTVCNQSFIDAKSTSTANCFGNFFDRNQGGQPSDEVFYKFTLNSQQKVSISHCGSVFDTYVSLLDANGNVLATADDTAKVSTTCTPNTASGAYNEAFMQRSLSAGTYYVVSEGYATNNGTITTQISVLPIRPPGASLATAIDAGTLSSCGALFVDAQSNEPASCFGNDYDASLNTAQREGRPTDDIFYKFTLTSTTEVTLSYRVSLRRPRPGHVYPSTRR